MSQELAAWFFSLANEAGQAFVVPDVRMVRKCRLEIHRQTSGDAVFAQIVPLIDLQLIFVRRGPIH
jgi:hypothetical protein